MSTVKQFKAPLLFLDGDEGQIQAAFSVFNQVDGDGDVVLPSFFTDGQPVAMAAWGHDWGNLPPGKGVIRVYPDKAVFDGKFFLNTTQGRDHYNTVKEMAELQEWSFGFSVTDAEAGEFDGRRVRFLKRGETYEASPVLIGANRNTYTMGIKSGLRLADEEAAVRAYVPSVVERFRSLGEKEGQAISRARRARINSLIDLFEQGTADLRTMLAEVEPEVRDESVTNDESDGKAMGVALFADFLRTQARLNGVAV